ncbi:sporulation histidine kinase inhibitor Sda [Alkalihalobacillus sp. BA299]|nr:sporulation histidine kinase inhibitor Sda [Alkalihalobacillus sp. BA299]
MLVKLSDEGLLEAYKEAIKYNLPKDFIQLLKLELERRETKKPRETK